MQQCPFDKYSSDLARSLLSRVMVPIVTAFTVSALKFIAQKFLLVSVSADMNPSWGLVSCPWGHGMHVWRQNYSWNSSSLSITVACVDVHELLRTSYVCGGGKPPAFHESKELPSR